MSTIKKRSQGFPLAAVDYLFCEKQHYGITFVLEFADTQDFAALKESLPGALEAFYPAKGRMFRDERDEYYVSDDVGGAFGAVSFELQEAPPVEPDEPLGLLRFAAPIDAALGNPVSHFRLTNTPTGSYLSASIAHAVADGYGYVLFLSYWAALTRRGELFTPSHARKRLAWTSADYGDLSPAAVLKATGHSVMDAPHPPSAVHSYASLKWEDAELAQYRSEATRELGRSVSGHDLASALMLKDCATRWHKPGDRIRMHCPIDFRRFIPEITPFFFGNAIRGVPLEDTYETITRSTVPALALRINEGISGITRADIDDHLRTMQGVKEVGGQSLIRRMDGWHPDFGMLVTNMTRMPLSQIDFGRGAPRQFCPIGAPRAYVMLRRPGAIEALVGLPA
ncbi:MAG: acyltransferase [Myxococcales bacterium]|nr:acyltransferase [Myxococcales bacterium]MDD9966495.1 acyltransferase [Myxococcales bacterium]